jgi:hypothetical protein
MNQHVLMLLVVAVGAHREVIVVPVAGPATECSKARVESLAKSSGRDVVVLVDHSGGDRSWSSPAWRTLRQRINERSPLSWRSFGDHRSGHSKPSFIRWFADSEDFFDFAWHIEEDAFFTGPWRHALAVSGGYNSNSSTADLLAPWFNPAFKGWPRQVKAQGACSAFGEGCFEGASASATQVPWPVLRLSRRLAVLLRDGLQSGAVHGHHEATTVLACRAGFNNSTNYDGTWAQHPNRQRPCELATLDGERVGAITLSGAALPSGVGKQRRPRPRSKDYTLKFAAFLNSGSGTVQPGKLYHPVKCKGKTLFFYLF